MTEKIEGTIVVDGLVEGRIPPLPQTEQRLRQWARSAAGGRLELSLEVDGNSFSILARNKPVQVRDLPGRPAEVIAEALNELLGIFPPADRPGVFSTLRSVEYRPGAEVQTLYPVGPDGTVSPRERTVDAQTTPPPQPLSRKQKVRLGVYGLVFALVVLLISSLFVDYRTLVRNAIEGFTPFRAEAVQVELAGFADYFSVAGKAAKGRRLVLTIKRSEAFPKSEQDLDVLLAQAGGAVRQRLTVQALALGYVRCEMFDKDGEFLGFTMQRIADLARKETLDLVLPMPGDKKPAKVVVCY